MDAGSIDNENGSARPSDVIETLFLSILKF